jgi:ABC-type sugar transport system substrate-binding protein
VGNKGSGDLYLQSPGKKVSCVLSLPGDNNYLREQVTAAKATAARLGIDLQIINAEKDAVLQSQQLLHFVQGSAESRPDAILFEPVNATGLPKVAEAAVAAGIAWIVNNAKVDYLAALRRTAKAPVFLVSQDHVEVGRIQGRQIAALLPSGGSVLYLRGPSTNSLASMRSAGIDGTKPKNVEVKNLKIQWTADNACQAISSWLSLPTTKPESTKLIVSQNADFILGARKAFEATAEPQRSKWLAIPCLGVGVVNQIKPLVDARTLRAAVFTSLTMDKSLEMLVRALRDGSQPPEQTFVEAQSYPALEVLAKPSKPAA